MTRRVDRNSSWQTSPRVRFEKCRITNCRNILNTLHPRWERGLQKYPMAPSDEIVHPTAARTRLDVPRRALS